MADQVECPKCGTRIVWSDFMTARDSRGVNRVGCRFCMQKGSALSLGVASDWQMMLRKTTKILNGLSLTEDWPMNHVVVQPAGDTYRYEDPENGIMVKVALTDKLVRSGHQLDSIPGGSIEGAYVRAVMRFVTENLVELMYVSGGTNNDNQHRE